ncbi:unnamed protein product [Schistosoma haematobium]|nr:unnamed protein product [Schistosoma haematobium]CAH8624988.1 unnamed protein product [Schistosoma haematobium]
MTLQLTFGIPHALRQISLRWVCAVGEVIHNCIVGGHHSLRHFFSHKLQNKLSFSELVKISVCVKAPYMSEGCQLLKFAVNSR